MSRSLVSVLTLLLVSAIFPATAQEEKKPAEKVTVAWSVWTGWMPHKIMEVEGFLDERNKEFGTNVQLQEFRGYMDSVQAFAAGKVDAVAMTSMESLQPASSGVRSVAVLANDVSNGGDGLLVREGLTINDIAKHPLYLEQFSVSHYLAARAAESAGIAPDELQIVNMPGDDVGKAFLSDENIKVAATWNPHLYLAQEAGTGNVVFSSEDIPGEIIDLVVFNAKIVEEHPDAVRAFVTAYYDACEMISNEATNERAVEIMADGAGTTPAEFRKLLGGTRLFTEPKQTIDFFQSRRIQNTMNRVRKFSHQNELITDPEFDIQFGPHDPANPALLWFDHRFAEEAIAGGEAE